MPRIIRGDEFIGMHTFTLPAVSDEVWLNGVKSLVARDLTTAELDRCEKMARHNWSIIVAAEDILGRAISREEVEARRNWWFQNNKDNRNAHLLEKNHFGHRTTQ